MFVLEGLYVQIILLITSCVRLGCYAGCLATDLRPRQCGPPVSYVANLFGDLSMIIPQFSCMYVNGILRSSKYFYTMYSKDLSRKVVYLRRYSIALSLNR